MSERVTVPIPNFGNLHRRGAISRRTLALMREAAAIEGAQIDYGRGTITFVFEDDEDDEADPRIEKLETALAVLEGSQERRSPIGDQSEVGKGKTTIIHSVVEVAPLNRRF
jgi:hypothetical protein